MFHDGSYMVGMHGFWWLFWLLMIGILLFYGRVGAASACAKLPTRSCTGGWPVARSRRSNTKSERR